MKTIIILAALCFLSLPLQSFAAGEFFELVCAPGFTKTALYPSAVKVVNYPVTSGTWLTASPEWVQLQEPVSFITSQSNALVHITVNDNVGIYGAKWCSLGIFIDDQVTPSCTASYSGVAGTTVFNNQSFSCNVVPPTVGIHTYTIKHQSQYCYYGNYSLSTNGFNRFISFEEKIMVKL